jgi:hypothetical protein
MFARYVMPRFTGHNAVYHREWERIRALTSDGRIAYDTGGKPSNLLTRSPLRDAAE